MDTDVPPRHVGSGGRVPDGTVAPSCFVDVSVVFPGELLRKKRREKGGHKDPLLQEISRLQEEVMTQISNLRREHEAAEKKRSEIEKVALILGLSPSDRPRRTSKTTEEQEDRAPQKEKQEAARNPEGLQAASGSMRKVGPPAESDRARLLM